MANPWISYWVQPLDGDPLAAGSGLRIVEAQFWPKKRLVKVRVKHIPDKRQLVPEIVWDSIPKVEADRNMPFDVLLEKLRNYK